MSPSILVCEDRHELFRDSELCAVVAFFEHLLEEQQLDASLRDAVATWRSNVEQAAFGAIDFDLDAIVAAGGRERLDGALAYAHLYLLRTWESEVPLSVMNRFDRSVVWFYECSVDYLQRPIARLRRLLNAPSPRALDAHERALIREASAELHRHGVTARACPRCGGPLFLYQRGPSYAVWCLRESDALLTSRGI